MEILGGRKSDSSRVPVAQLAENQGLVLFFCSFLALRSENVVNPIVTIKDYDIHKEDALFAG